MSNLTENQTKTAEILTVVTVEQKPEKKKRKLTPYLIAAGVVLCLGMVAAVVALLLPRQVEEQAPVTEEAVSTRVDYGLPEWMTAAFLTEDGESRTGEKMEEVLDIAVHYVANPGTSAMANRNYFEGPDSNTSSHFIVGLEGEVLALIPTDEKSCATNERNSDTVSVEVCHPDETGVFADATYESLIRLLTYLCTEFDLTEENLIRHYDVTGKMCPLYYVEHPDAWDALKSDVKEALAKGMPDDTKA